MAKDLLKITHVKDAICSSEINVETEADLDRIAAGLLTVMVQNESFAKMLGKTVLLFIEKQKEIVVIAEEARRSADVKLKN